MSFLVFVSAFVVCACVVVPVGALGFFVAADRRERRIDRERKPVSIGSAEGVR